MKKAIKTKPKVINPTLQIRDVPVQLRRAFRLAALQQGATIREAIIELMSEYVNRALKK